MYYVGQVINVITILEIDIIKKYLGKNRKFARVVCKCGLESLKLQAAIKNNVWNTCGPQCKLRCENRILEKNKVNSTEYIVDIGFENDYVKVIQHPKWKTISNNKTQTVRCLCKFCGQKRNIKALDVLNNKNIPCPCTGNFGRNGTKAENGWKICGVCQKNKRIKEFNKENRRSDGLNSYCKECLFYYKVNFRYNLDKDNYQELLKKQDYKCACCKSDISYYKNKRKFAVDHIHKTPKNKNSKRMEYYGDIRGLVCSKCNKGIGILGDNREGVQKAMNYLNNFYEEKYCDYCI